MTPARLGIFMIANVYEGNLEGANEVVFGKVIMIPDLKSQVLCFGGDACSDLQGLVPLGV